jgi:hypothetical protein
MPEQTRLTLDDVDGPADHSREAKRAVGRALDPPTAPGGI